MPEAPQGSFRRRDIEAVQREGEDGGRPIAQKGIDGKVYDFVAAGPDESESADGASKQLSIQKEAAESQKGKKEKSKKSKKKGDKKKKKEKKKQKEKKKDKKKSKKKRKKHSSDSSDGSSGPSSSSS